MLRHWFTALAVIVSVTAPLARAANIETLLMPGKVAAAHAKLEETCTNCHDRANRDRQSALCSACHKEVAADVRAHAGYHGRLANIDRAQCKACHSDHLGRDADIVRISEAAFRHDDTDFPLRGQHALTDCSGCHAKGKKYREAQHECIACHKKIEPHAGKLGKDCGSCHEERAWSRIRFDHNKTSFPLRDAHQQAPCASCHFGNRYKNTPQQCVSCHAPDDVHRGARGEACGKCHTTKEWKTAKFDHAKETGFALRGAHADVDCLACHKTGRMQDKIPKDCVGCHRGEDAHAGRLGAACDKCHSSIKWKPSAFDHTRDTKYGLTGKHIDVDCHSCHTANVAQQKLGADCRSCHRAQDVHSGKLGDKCEQCHQTDGWRTDIAFDHDLVDFPLVGLHVTTPCAQCHVSRAFKGVAKDCNDCHQRDDVHKGGLGKDCASCHTPNGWGIWDFDHAKRTHFALTGAHKALACADCHKRPAHEVKLATNCASCHAQDDPHLGQYGRQCQRCHTAVTFKGARLR